MEVFVIGSVVWVVSFFLGSLFVAEAEEGLRSVNDRVDSGDFGRALGVISRASSKVS
jgi:hypothetical protein